MGTKAVLSPERVQEFVGVAHGSLERVTSLLAEEPALVNAAWDWGGGDWETALGAASHMGRRDIAEVLLAHGARLDIFAAAMLGRLDVVSAMVKADPAAKNARGPHGIPLLAHAMAGGEAAESVVRYLTKKENEDRRMGQARKVAAVGTPPTFRWLERTFEFGDADGCLRFSRGEILPRPI